MDMRRSGKFLTIAGVLCFVFAFALLSAFKGQFGKDTAGISSEAEMEDTAEIAPKQLTNESGGRKEYPDNDSTASGSECVVYITGAVKKPGVYDVSSNARIFSAVEAAGGFTSEADREAVNLAAKLKDGQHIKIYKIGEMAEAQTTKTKSGTSSKGGNSDVYGKININTASKTELERINGVGTKTAEAILSYRNSKGNFTRIEDIMEVKGIGPKKFEKMRESITVGD
ncbi:MAG: ComEA family DNA-binding protein [Synergistes sp.]|nr:ComEA family DNA-binding protein [Synergistes sp.]